MMLQVHIRLQTVGSTENVQFINGSSNESIILIHKDSARVGIGTVSASAKLEISSSTTQDALQVRIHLLEILK
jgi:hypothetical protein